MKTPEQILQDAREEFEKKFKDISHVGCDNSIPCGTMKNDVFSWHTSTLQSFKEALMAELKEEITVSWDTADGGTEWVVQFWRQKADGTKELFQQIDKKSDDGGSFKLSTN